MTTRSEGARPVWIKSNPNAPKLVIINDLSDDVLILIFLLSLEPGWPGNQVRISHVCRRWRLVALDTAGPWTKIAFRTAGLNIYAKPDVLFSQPLEWIRRSKGALLDIEIQDYMNVSREEDEPDEPDVPWPGRWIANTIRPLSHRWRSFTIKDIPFEDTVSFFEAVSSVDVPEILSFSVSYTNSDAPLTIAPFNQHGAPKLQDLNIPGMFLILNHPFVNTLCNLRSVYISDNEFSEGLDEKAAGVVNLIRRSPMLEALCIDQRTWPPFQETTQPPVNRGESVVIATRLSDFRVTWPTIVGALLPYVKFPALVQTEFIFIRKLLPFIFDYNPFPNLRTMTIMGGVSVWDRPISSIPRFLSRLEKLENLEIWGVKSSIEDEAKEWVCQFASICPRLEILSLDWDLGISEEAVRLMVSGRQGSLSQLRSLTLRNMNAGQYSEEWADWLKRNVAEVEIIVKRRSYAF